jgi:hypothetical protein
LLPRNQSRPQAGGLKRSVYVNVPPPLTSHFDCLTFPIESDGENKSLRFGRGPVR